MIAGSSKAKLGQFDMQISLPTVIMGKHHSIQLGSGIAPVSIKIDSPWGPLCLDVGLVVNNAVEPAVTA